MAYNVIRYALNVLCVTSLTFGVLPRPVFSQPAGVTGTIAGKVFDEGTRTALAGVTVQAHLITTNQRFTSQETDARGSYLISSVPPGIYAFYLYYQGTEFPIDGRLNARQDMSFLVESCFQLDRVSKTAALMQECHSGVYAETQVASIGARRFFRPLSSALFPDVRSTEASQGQTELSVTHRGLKCLTRDRFAELSAVIQPGSAVQSARVYFRAAQYPDFYYVDMQGTGEEFLAVLPRPAPETERVIYYIQAEGQELNTVQTEEYSPEVTDLDTCGRRDPVAAYFTGENPNIVVGATVSGAPAVPPGFQAAGIASFIGATGAAAGAGLGTTGVVLIVAGGAAAATLGIVTAVTGEEEASPIR